MKITKIPVTITFTEQLLGSQPGNPDIAKEHLISKAPSIQAQQEEAEVAEREEQFEKAKTVFAKDDKGLFYWDYALRGFFKDQFLGLIELGDIPPSQMTKWSYKRCVDNFLLVGPRRIYLMRDGQNVTKADGDLQRALRATTLQGDRIALATSELLNPGCSLSFEVTLIEPNSKSNDEETAEEGKKRKPRKTKIITPDDIRNALDFGSMKGFGQWRNSGAGRFTWTSTFWKE